MADLIINGNDALATYGIRMGDGFIDSLGMSANMKEYITNDSRLKDGIDYCKTVPKRSSRELTLQFVMMSSSASGLSAFRSSFYSMLYAGDVKIEVPENTGEVYKLKYKNSVSYSSNIRRNSCKISVKFEEPDPTDRG